MTISSHRLCLLMWYYFHDRFTTVNRSHFYCSADYLVENRDINSVYPAMRPDVDKFLTLNELKIEYCRIDYKTFDEFNYVREI